MTQRSLFKIVFQINWVEMSLFCLLLAGLNRGCSQHRGIYGLTAVGGKSRGTK